MALAIFCDFCLFSICICMVSWVIWCRPISHKMLTPFLCIRLQNLPPVLSVDTYTNIYIPKWLRYVILKFFLCVILQSLSLDKCIKYLRDDTALTNEKKNNRTEKSSTRKEMIPNTNKQTAQLNWLNEVSELSENATQKDLQLNGNGCVRWAVSTNR